MKKSLFLVLCSVLFCTTACGAGAPPIVFRGDTLPQNTDFLRRQCGSVSTSLGLPEISGIACSRETPGYIWMQSDDYESKIIATDEKGRNMYMKVKFSKTVRWDWEDMSSGVYNGTNYLFIGAFGDNEETDGNYSIVYLEEPAIGGSTEITVSPSVIKFIYPDSLNHNCEALMYDNIEQRIYIITKVYYNVCQVFYLPFSLDYGDEVQRLTYVCDLGYRSDLGAGASPYKGFHLVTGADISPDGKYILIKNHNNIVAKYSWILLWKREGEESVTETLLRQPESIACYQSEWQGEAICWRDSTVFYTTSDSDGEPPIYQYVNRNYLALDNVPAEDKSGKLMYMNGVLYIRHKDGLFTMDGRKVQ